MTQGCFPGTMEIEKGRSVAPGGILVPTLPAELISQLFIKLLSEGYTVRSLALGESMSPCIKKGDHLMVKPN